MYIFSRKHDLEPEMCNFTVLPSDISNYYLKLENNAVQQLGSNKGMYTKLNNHNNIINA